jgi:predicted transcriptional regulator
MNYNSNGKMELLQLLERIASKIAPGRSPLFTEAYVIKALEEVKTQGEIGRIRLSEVLGLSEGTTRTLIRHLKQQGLITISRSGIRLSERGMKLHSTLRAEMSKGIGIPQSPLTVGVFNIAILVKNAGSMVRSGLEQRDAAIMMGAHGATTLVFSKNKLIMPGVAKDVFKGFPSIRATLMSELKPKENDVIIIGSATNRRTAELGAKMAALQLLRTNP